MFTGDCAAAYQVLKKYKHNMTDVDLELLSVYGIDRFLFVVVTVHLIKHPDPSTKEGAEERTYAHTDALALGHGRGSLCAHIHCYATKNGLLEHIHARCPCLTATSCTFLPPTFLPGSLILLPVRQRTSSFSSTKIGGGAWSEKTKLDGCTTMST